MADLDRLVYRVVTSRHDPLDSTGATLVGGRCNPAGLPTLYFATTVPGALSESLRASDLLSVGPFKPKLLLCVHARLETVVDLGDVAQLERLGLDSSALTEPWHGRAQPTTLQRVCAALQERGIRGVLYPSVLRTDSSNLAVFVDNLRDTDLLQVVES